MQANLRDLTPYLHAAQLSADTQFNGVISDSRKVAPGNLFIALRGEHFDAHEFLTQVEQAGAAAVLVEHLPEGCRLPALIVPDTRLAMLELAQYWRQQFAIPVVGVTGSNGKTTVKEMIASIFAVAYGGSGFLATRGNLNNEIGVPLTLFDLNNQHRAAVIEMGMNHRGEIASLAKAAQPTVALVNNAQREHQEFMQTVQAVAEENGAALLALSTDGIAVFPADDAYSQLWQSYADKRTCLRFGLSDKAEVHASYSSTAFGNLVHLNIFDMAQTLEIHAAGQHNVLNALAAAACCHAVGISFQDICTGLTNFCPVNGRLQRKSARTGASIIDDTYNANPDSVRAAIDVLSLSAHPRVLVLGDMGEVGEQGAQFHAEIGTYARERGIEHVMLLGDLTAYVAQAFGTGAQHFDSIEELQKSLDSLLSANMSILIKGSRFMKMERIVAYLSSTNPI